jgi:hypothetical protein
MYLLSHTAQRKLMWRFELIILLNEEVELAEGGAGE